MPRSHCLNRCNCHWWQYCWDQPCTFLIFKCLGYFWDMCFHINFGVRLTNTSQSTVGILTRIALNTIYICQFGGELTAFQYWVFPTINVVCLYLVGVFLLNFFFIKLLHIFWYFHRCIFVTINGTFLTSSSLADI